MTTERTRAIESRQAAYLGRIFPSYRTARLRWSGGTTQVIEAGEGEPVLFIHGGLGEAFQWAPLFPLLASRYRMLAVDRPGHGLADAFDYEHTDVLAHAQRFIGEVLDALRLTCVPIAGTSMGGLWATAFALANPERVSRLILVGSPAGATPSVPWMLRLAILPGFRAVAERAMARPTPADVRRFWKLLVAHPERLAADFLELSAESQAHNYRNWLSLVDRVVSWRGFKPELLLTPHWEHLRMPRRLSGASRMLGHQSESALPSPRPMHTSHSSRCRRQDTHPGSMIPKRLHVH
jgi:pimeloyl-ACP methyl ester carboxylesterase